MLLERKRNNFDSVAYLGSVLIRLLYTLTEKANDLNLYSTSDS